MVPFASTMTEAIRPDNSRTTLKGSAQGLQASGPSTPIELSPRPASDSGQNRRARRASNALEATAALGGLERAVAITR